MTKIEGFTVPKLLHWDDNLWVIEMQCVSPPFVLDFGKAYLDRPPPYFDSMEIMADDEAQRAEWFGRRWPQVKSLVSRLQRYGIYYVDAKPGNIMFGDEDRLHEGEE